MIPGWNLKEERLQVLFTFGWGCCTFGMTQISANWLIQCKSTAAMSTVIIMYFLYNAFGLIKRCGTKFHFAENISGDFAFVTPRVVDGSQYVQEATQALRGKGIDAAVVATADVKAKDDKKMVKFAHDVQL